MCAIFILYVRVIFFVCGFFFYSVWSGMHGGGREFLWLPLSPDNTFLRETLFVTYRGDHQGRSQDLGGGRAKNFFFRFGNLHVAKPYASLGGFGGMPPKKNFLNCAIWCVLVCILIRFIP